MTFNSNVAPVRVVKEAVKREPWKCECFLSIDVEGADGPPLLYERHNPPGLKRCGKCGQARP